MAFLIKNPLNLGPQVFRITRGLMKRGRRQDGQVGSTFTPAPGFWEAQTCKDFSCSHYALGWCTTVDLSTELGKAQADYIRKRSGKIFNELADECYYHGPQPGLLSIRHFNFGQGQECFRDHESAAVGFSRDGPHLKPVDRDPLFKNIAQGRETKNMDYDEYFDTVNEVVVQLGQKGREV